MSHPLIAHFQTPAWAANATQEIRTDRLPSTLDGMPAHIVSIDCKLALTITDSSESGGQGWDIYNTISRLRIRDVLGNEILHLRGRHLRALMKQVRGWRHPDPTDLPATGSGSLTRVLEFQVPFHGEDGGILGSMEYDDYWLPVDRIRGVPIEVQWSAADYGTAGDAEVTDATLYMNFVLKPYKTVVVGADVRWGFLDQAASAALHVPLKGKALHSLGVMIQDLDHTDFTDFTIQDFAYMNRANLWQLVSAWNTRCALDVAQFEAIADPEFIPVIFQDRRDAVTGLVMFPLGRLELQTTTTATEAFELMTCEIFDTQDLCRKLMGRPQTVFQGANLAVPKYAKKNQPGRNGRGANQRVANRLNHLLAHQLRRR